MKIIVFISALLIFIFSAFYDDFINSDNQIEAYDKNASKHVMVEMALPNFVFKDLDGNEKNIKSFLGRPILLNFWASWCGPCLQEFPHIMKLVKENKDLLFIAISNDQKKGDIRKFINKFKKDYASILSSEQVLFAWDPKREISSDKFNVLKLPETFIINKKLKIVRKIIGANDWTEDNLDAFLKSL